MTAAIRTAWPRAPAGKALWLLISLGFTLRFLAIVSLRPTTILEDGYQNFAQTNPFTDPLHPAGYSMIIAAMGAVTHDINVTVLIQHFIGVGSALLLAAATRRVTGSAWAGLLPAGIVLLGGDEIFLEHSIMSESWAQLAASLGLYGGVRALDDPVPWIRWPLITGAALAIAVTIRDANLPLVVVAVIALLAGRRVRWWIRWRAPFAVAATAALVLVAYAGANARFGYRFGIAPSPGWYLYGRVAQFADCTRFTPPRGTAALCQRIAIAQRPSGYSYMFVPQQSPALRLFGTFGRQDGLVGAWAQRALRAQFGDFLATGWSYLRSYYVPGSLPARLKDSTGLDPQLDFTNEGNVFYAALAVQALESFYGRLSIHRAHGGLRLLRASQLLIRFGATALFIATVLTLIGLVIGTRRSRVGALLFGVGGLSLLITPVLTGTYSGRYTVPMAGPLMAAAAITITEVYRARSRRTSIRPDC